MKKQLHQGVKWMWRFRNYLTLGIILFFLVYWIFIRISLSLMKLYSPQTLNIPQWILFLVIIVVIVDIICVEIYVRLAYNRWFYEFTGSNFKIEHGIIWKHYKSIPYERVQNVDIHRGVMARLLGFSSVIIHTAGYSFGHGVGAGFGGAEGFIPAVDAKDAEKIREFLMKKIGKRGRGL